MAEPEIQYCTTKDGVSIAYQVVGRGPPMIFVSLITSSHLSLSWRTNKARYEALAEDFTLVRYDGRGSGLSQREPADFSLEARLLDLEAVIDRTQSAGFALRGSFTGALAAIPYAARNPGRLTALVLEDPVASGARFYQETPVGRFLLALREITVDQWESVTLAQANRMMEVYGAQSATDFAAQLRASIAPEAAIQVRDATLQIDVTPLLSEVAAPTLVLHRERSQTPLSFSQAVAAAIPNARLTVLGPPPMGTPGWLQTTEAMKAFLGVAPARAAGSDSMPAGLVTILFTDLVSSTALTQRLGDAKAQELVRAHNTIVRDALRSHGGTEIKHTGDGIMASFGSASSALDCGVTIQRAVDRSPPRFGEGSDKTLSIKIGLNAGEPVAEESDLFGTAVQLARRVCDQASGGEILVSDVVRQLAAGKNFLFSDRGVADLKGFDEPVRLFEVRWRDEG